MKKRVFVIAVLILALVMSMFTGCAGAAKPLRVCVDLDAWGADSQKCEVTMTSFLDTVAMMGGPKDVVLEVIPRDGTERANAMKRLRTEIMAGEGPDVFIMMCAGGYNGGEAFFQIPEKAMKAGLFLPLDEYIENAQFMEWDKQTETVMAAGRDEYGQQILPLAYTLPLTFYRASDVEGVKPDAETTWNDMLADDTGVLSSAATWFHTDKNVTYYAMNDDYLEYALGVLADYDKDELLFTEEELLQRVTEILDLRKAYKTQVFTDTAHYQSLMMPGYNKMDADPNDNIETYRYENGLDPLNGIEPREEVTMIPIYSDDGGTTASIISFCAIGANTKRPEDAFFIVDLLMSQNYQQNAEIYSAWLANSAITVQENILTEEVRVKYSSNWYLPDENYAEFDRIRDQITHVRFRGGLELVLDEMFDKCSTAYNAGQDLAPIVDEYYAQMKRLMAE